MVLYRYVQLYLSDKRTVGTASGGGLRNCAHFGVQPPASMHADSCRILRFFDVWCLISQPHANCWGFFRIEIVQHELTVFRSLWNLVQFRQLAIWSASYSSRTQYLWYKQLYKPFVWPIYPHIYFSTWHENYKGCTTDFSKFRQMSLYIILYTWYELLLLMVARPRSR